MMKNPLKPAKDTLRIATWNIRTLLKPEAKHLLADDMNTLGIEVACLQETRIAGDTTETIQDSTGAPSLKLCLGLRQSGSARSRDWHTPPTGQSRHGMESLWSQDLLHEAACNTSGNLHNLCICPD